MGDPKEKEEKVYHPKSTPKKQDFSRLVAENRLLQVLDEMMDYALENHLVDVHNALIVQSAKFEQYQKNINLGIIDYDDLTRTHSSISLALIDIIRSIPSEESIKKKPRKDFGIRESLLKYQILWSLLIGKIFLLGYLFNEIESGAIPFYGFLLVAGVIFPNFASHLTHIIQNLLQAKYKHFSVKTKRINRSIQITVYLVLGIYLAGLFFTIDNYLAGKLTRVIDDSSGVKVNTFENLLLLLALIESSLGVYLGVIIGNLFKSKD